MALNANKTKNKSGKEIPPVAAGSYPARLVVVADLGLQNQRPFKGEPKKPAYEVLITLELTDEFMKKEDGEDDLTKPRWVSDTFVLYNLQSSKATSTKYYLAFDPEGKLGGDWEALIGRPVMATLVINEGKDGKLYNNIAGLAPMRAKDADKLTALVNEPVVFNTDTSDAEVFKKLPAWVQKKIMEGLEYKGSPLATALGGTYTPATNKNSGAAKAAESGPPKDQEDLDDEIPF